MLLHDTSLETITILLFSIAVAYLLLLIGYIIFILGTFQWSIVAHALLCLLIFGIALGLSIKSCKDNSNLVLFSWVSQKFYSFCDVRAGLNAICRYSLLSQTLALLEP